jgi:hypothetical protein
VKRRTAKRMIGGSLTAIGFVSFAMLGGVGTTVTTTGDQATGPAESPVVEARMPDGRVLVASVHEDRTDVRPRTSTGITSRTAAAAAGNLGASFPAAIAPKGIDARSVSCVPRGTPYSHRAVYAYPSDRSNQVAAWIPRIRESIAYSSELFHSAAIRKGGTGARLRVQCDAGQIIVDTIALPQTTAQLTGDRWTDGYGAIAWSTYHPTTHVVGFLDVPGGWGGIGTKTSDVQPGAANTQNAYALAFMYGNTDVAVVVHEIGHTLGAVKGGAPNVTAGGHCTDGVDTMCRGADGTTGSERFAKRCPEGPFGSAVTGEIDGEMDCGGDDYFNPRPVAGSWLARSWNVASSANRYIDTSSTPAYVMPSIEHVTIETNAVAFVSGDLRGIRAVRATVDGVDVAVIQRLLTPRGGIHAVPVDRSTVSRRVVLTVEGAWGLSTRHELLVPGSGTSSPPPTPNSGMPSPSGGGEGGAVTPPPSGGGEGGAVTPPPNPGFPSFGQVTRRSAVITFSPVRDYVAPRGYSVIYEVSMTGRGSIPTERVLKPRFVARGLLPRTSYRICVRAQVTGTSLSSARRCARVTTRR